MKHPNQRRFPTALCLSLLVLSLAVSGCALGPYFSGLKPEMPPSWMEAEQDSIHTDLAPPPNWWSVYEDPALVRLVEESMGSNLSVALAGLRVFQARAELGVAVGNLYPQTQNVSGNYAIQQGSMRSPTAPQPNQPQIENNFKFTTNQIGLNAVWEIDLWGKYRRAIESGEATVGASMADRDAAIVALAADVAQAYITLRTAEARVGIAKTNTQLQREGLKIAEARYRLGSTSERDVAQAKALLASTEASIPTFIAQTAQARHALCVLLGRTPESLDEFLAGQTGKIPVGPAEIACGLPNELLRRRPDIRAAELKAAAACANVGVAKTDMLPSLSLAGSIGWSSSNVGMFRLTELFTRQSFLSSFSPGVTWNVLNYGRIINNVRSQDAAYQQAIVDHANTVLKALQETEDAMSYFLQTRRRVIELGKAVDSSKRGAELAFIQYREGQTDFTTVIVAQQDLLTRQDSLASAQGDAAKYLAQLYRALGGGFEIEGRRELIPAAMRAQMVKRTYWGALLDSPSEYLADPAKARNIIQRYTPDL